MPSARRLGACLVVLLMVVLVVPAAAQEPAAAVAPPPEERPDPFLGEIIRARILVRLGRVEEALAAFEALVARRPGDRALREDFAETLIDAGMLDRAAVTLDRFLLDDPRSRRIQRLRARVDLERGEPRLAAGRLETLLQEAQGDAGILADLAGAETRDGRWRRALALYGDVLQREPENNDVRAARRELAVAHASRIEVLQRTLLQAAATHHVQELAWKGWLSDRWWLRAGARHGHYTQDSLVGLAGFTEEIQTALATVGYQLSPRWSASAGLEESQRGEVLRTTVRLGGAFDDGKTTYATLDTAARERLTNPVRAIPKNGATDRVALDVSRRLADRLVGAAHYGWRHFTVSGQELGAEWELLGRADVELLKGPVYFALGPQLFFSEYAPAAGSPLRDQVGFTRRQDVIAASALLGLDLWPGARAQFGSVGRRDLHRAVTSWEVTGDVRWRFRSWLELQVLYTRNTESSLVGGKEESFTGGINILY